MAESPQLIGSNLIDLPHAFLTGPQSESGAREQVSGHSPPVVVKQVHSAKAVRADGPFEDGSLPEADAIVTARPGLWLAIVTADCAPVLLADQEAGVIGAAHAGWRGALDGIIGATVTAMSELGAEAARIVAAIGPAIGQENYEVDESFRERFVEADASYARFFNRGRPGHHQFDLEGFVALQLSMAGVVTVDCLGIDTYAAEADFFSFRRSTHRGEPTGGRQVSMIGLRETA